MAQHIAGRIYGRAINIVEEIKNHPNFAAPINQITAANILGGMRGLTLIPWTVSAVDTEKGVMYRRKSLPEVISLLPKSAKHKYPSAETVFQLLLSGSDDKDTSSLTAEQAEEEAMDLKMLRIALDCSEVEDDLIIRSCRAVDISRDAHPMTQFIQGLIGAQNSSLLAECYNMEIDAQKIASSTLIDGTKLLQFLPILVGYIYRRCTQESLSPTRYLQKVRDFQDKEPHLDWCGHLVRYMGLVDHVTDREIIFCYEDLMRLFIMSHADHEGGNVSAHLSHITSSAHADIFYAYLAAMCGLAGPLHGMANQQSLAWQKRMLKKTLNESSLKGDIRESDTEDFIRTSEFTDCLRKLIHDELESGGKIPGFGHAVLRVTDPRYSLFKTFGENLLADKAKRNLLSVEAQNLIRFNHLLADIVPEVMTKNFPKIQSPWPNVDLGSGVILSAMGVNEPTTFTMLFGLARALGIVAGAVWARSLKLPIERPKSITPSALLEILNNPGKSDSDAQQ